MAGFIPDFPAIASAGEGPAIHVFITYKQIVDARHEAGHDGRLDSGDVA